jgi:hypothetical protein
VRVARTSRGAPSLKPSTRGSIFYQVKKRYHLHLRFGLWLLGILLLGRGGVLAADTLYLKNNTVFLGELRSINLGKAEFDLDFATIVNIKVTNISTIRAETNFYRVQTTNKKIYLCRILPDTVSGHVLLSNSEMVLESVALNDISALSYYHQSGERALEGHVTLGYTYTRSSDIGRINFDGTIKYLLPKSDIKFTGSSIITQNEGHLTRDRESGSLSTTKYFSTDWRAMLLLNYQRNLELGLARRFQQGLGVAYTYLNTRHLQGVLLSGFFLNQEKSTDGVAKKPQAELPFLITFDFFRLSKPDISVASVAGVFVSLTQKGRVRQDADLRVRWKVIGDFSLNLQIYNNFDNQPPVATASKLDYGIVFGLGYKF